MAQFSATPFAAENSDNGASSGVATDALVERLFGAAIDTLEVASVHIGGRLGFYRSLADDGNATSAELAVRTGTDERYVREWLEQQAVAGFLSVDDPERKPGERRYQLPVAHRPVFADEEDLNYLTPLATLAIGVLRPIDALLDAYRSGGGGFRTRPTGPTPERGSAQSTDRSSSTSSANGSHPSPRSTHA
jgi:hypothetical protein